jgi:antirestriction protein ArdC
MAAARRGYQRRPAGQSPAAKYGDVYEQVNNRILASLDAGAVPWQRPWPASVGRPMSMASGQPYNGVNVLLAGMTALERGYTSPWWGTKLQINALGGHIRQGQRQSEGKGATYISVWNEREVKPTAEEVAAGADPDEPKIKVYGSMRGVFNADQCEGLPERFYPEPGAPVEEIAEPEAVLAAYDATPGAALLLYDVHGQAYYDPDADRIHMPSRDGHISATATSLAPLGTAAKSWLPRWAPPTCALPPASTPPRSLNRTRRTCRAGSPRSRKTSRPSSRPPQAPRRPLT